MPINKKMNQQEIAKGSTEPLATKRQPGPKALGTRVGTIEDWRGGSVKSGRRSSVLRDGR